MELVNNRLVRRLASHAASAGLAAVLLVHGGCASSKASKAIMDRKEIVSLKDMGAFAQELVTEFSGSAGWKEFCAGHRAEGIEVVMLINKFENRTGDPMWDVKGFEDFYRALQRVCTNNRVCAVKQSVNKGDPGYVEGLNRILKQDSDDGHDQKTGRVATGGAYKATCVMRIDIAKQTLPNPSSGRTVEYRFQVEMIDGVKGTTVYIAEKNLEQ